MYDAETKLFPLFGGYPSWGPLEIIVDDIMGDLYTLSAKGGDCNGI